MENVPIKERYVQIAAELSAMVKVDPDMRKRSHTDKDYWDENIDKANTEKLKTIIEEIGWPTVSKVGEEGMKDAWLIAQHADRDPEFQSVCLAIMKELPDGEVSTKLVAYLEDRVRINLGQKQLYGTQFIQKNGDHIPLPIEDEAHVDERRAAMGMDTLNDQIKLMYDKYGIPEK